MFGLEMCCEVRLVARWGEVVALHVFIFFACYFRSRAPLLLLQEVMAASFGSFADTSSWNYVLRPWHLQAVS